MVSDNPTPERDRDRDRSLSALAYDLLNVLTAIRGQAQTTHRRIGRVDRLSRDHIASDLERIGVHTERMTGLIDGLHGAARPPRSDGAPTGVPSARPKPQGRRPAPDRGERP